MLICDFGAKSCLLDQKIIFVIFTLIWAYKFIFDKKYWQKKRLDLDKFHQALSILPFDFASPNFQASYLTHGDVKSVTKYSQLVLRREDEISPTKTTEILVNPT